MNWLDNIKHLVVEEDPEPTTSTSTAPVATVATAPPRSVPYYPDNAAATITHSTVITSTASASITPGTLETFIKRLRDKLNTTGASVSKFESTFASLSAITDPSMRLTTTLAILQSTLNIDTSQILADYKVRTTTLDNEAVKFKDALQSQTVSEIDTRTSNVAKIAEDIKAKSIEIQNLSAQRDKLNTEIGEQRIKLTAAQAGFEGAASILRTELRDALDRITAATSTGGRAANI